MNAAFGDVEGGRPGGHKRALGCGKGVVVGGWPVEIKGRVLRNLD